ncbi:hypothetical protein A2774_05080 [Candidatus Roizmanbacteria bacterium RIFCSPHIGHO2_01_FULL_39_12c]|uniref:Uncharacterized protein n=1 Tax=Candidatus Roizmanbacteria bacterium RIFCSPHIGHO2_01_FULL_39_12c TaxID=1802031 RepID=A0A1F7G9L3_9BACT|nr:MAG: hypothetical protein A2774_05080 [Candidatus Roizmanbacteria bacterium RIFCSPHIGHO2_01_FULL_39_12c]OGK46507.1 MAG: hypothetical protein A2963_01935 [Candidatus Roizmanbacteria bacterium RIFCSPLOWO2_01_FULL_40_13]
MKHKTSKKPKRSIFRRRNMALLLLITFYLIVNIVSSQIISPLFFKLINEDKNTVTGFLTRIKSLADFSRYLQINKKIYGEGIEIEVFAEDVKRKQKIAEFEALLSKNSRPRDILYNLYLLYNEEGDGTKAMDYLRKAKEVDPALK